MPFPAVRIWFLATLALALAPLARAQVVRWEFHESGQPGVLNLVFENCQPQGDPVLPAVSGVTFQPVSSGTNMQFGTGGSFRFHTITYVYRPATPITIPEFTVNTNRGPLRVAAFNTAKTAPSLDTIAGARLMPERASVWAGEVFGLTYELSAARRYSPNISPTFEWNPAPLIVEDWSKPEITEAMVNGQQRVNVTFRTRAIAKHPNTFKLEGATHLMNIQTGSVASFFGPQPRMEQVSVPSDQPTIEVKPLPTPPAGFSGAVGQFKLTAKVVPEKAAVGEPITWTLELAGTGNWPDIAGLPAREVSNDFQVVQPKAKRTPAEGKLFDTTLTEDVVLVPTKPGRYHLGPTRFVYFDPKAGGYKTLTTPRTTIAVLPAAAPSFAPAPSSPGTEEPAAEKPETRRPPPAIARAPGGLPRDPLPGTAEAAAPLSARRVAALALSPFALLLGFWAALAVRRARETDPIRPRREARDRLARTLALLPAAAEYDRAPLLLAWQRDAAVLWQIAHAAPRAAALPDAGWATLWSEADRALYGAKAALPADWVARAQEALVAKRVPGFQPWRLFLPQNLMPFAAALLVLLGAPWSLLLAAGAGDPAAAYRKGEFAAAEKAWRDRLASAPTDWIARHNLALALAQQERAGEAAAHAIAAFVQHPRDPSVRWHLALAAEKSGAIPAPLDGFLAGGPWPAVARLASPAGWQRVLIGAAWLAAAAVAALLFNAYGRRARAVTLAGALGLALGLVLAGAALAGRYSYGLAGRADAVVVARPGTLRSIPTEADTTQKTSPLGAGALALADKTFLGWIRLAFENGQTGWVRREEIVPLWK